MGKKIELNKPPVVEVVIGTQYDGPVFDNNLIYNFYQKIKSEFPKIQENPALPSIIAHPSHPNQTRILQGFNTRRFFINENGDKLIQLQSDRLLFNWRKNSEKDEYPQFTSVLEEFLKVYEKLKSESNVLPEKVNQMEITFIDHIILKDFELKAYKLNEIFNHFSFPQDFRNFECNFSIPQETIYGNLTLIIRSAINNKDQNRLVVCETTCRGNRVGSESMLDWYKKAHEILLDFFIDLFTEKAKAIWGGKK